MRRRTLIPVLLLLSGCGEPARQSKLLTPSVKSVLGSPDSVRVFRLHPDPVGKGAKESVTWADARTTAEVVPDAATMKELSALLSDPRTYDFEGGKGCIPHPGVKVCFMRGAATVDACLCFECLMMCFYGSGASGDDAWVDFDPGAPALTRLVKKLFPNDPAIQSLK